MFSYSRTSMLDNTLEGYYRVLYEPQKMRGKSESQKENYRIQFKHFARFLNRPATVDDLTDATVAKAMDWIVSRGRTNRTANKFRDLICALWRFLARKRIETSAGEMLQEPDVEPLPEPERIPVAWTREQLVTLFSACQNQPGFIAGIPADLWWHALHSLIWDTGERIRPIYSLEWRDLDLSSGYVTIRAETRKGRTRDMQHRLHPDTVKLLERFGPRRDRERVLPWPHPYDYLWNRYKRLLKFAGLPNGRERMFHCIRKSVASWFESAGGNATELLDHSSRKITKRYLDPRIVGKTHASDLLFRPEGPKPAA